VGAGHVVPASFMLVGGNLQLLGTKAGWVGQGASTEVCRWNALCQQGFCGSAMGGDLE